MRWPTQNQDPGVWKRGTSSLAIGSYTCKSGLTICRSMSAQAILFATLVLWLLAVPMPARALEDAHLDALLAGSAEHLAKYRFAQFHFLLTDARAKTLDDALAGRYLAEPAPMVANVEWAFSGNLYRRITTYKEEDLERVTTYLSGGRRMRSHSSRSYLWNDHLEIEDGPNQNFDVHAKGMMLNDSMQPFHVGMGSAVHVRINYICKQLGGTAKFVETRTWRDEVVHVLEVRMPPGKSNQIDRYYVDTQRGYMPVRIETYFGTLDQVRHIVEVLEWSDLGQGRWLPKLFRLVSLDANPIWVREVRVQSIDIDRPPPPESFTLRGKPGDHGFNRFTKQQLVTKTGKISLSAFRSDGTLLPNPDIEVWTPGSQRNLATSTSAKVDRPPATSEVAEWPFGPQPEDSTMRWWLAALAAVLAIAAIVIWRLKKK